MESKVWWQCHGSLPVTLFSYKASLVLANTMCFTQHIPSQEDKIAVIVGTVTDDVRVYEVPKLRVCALRFTATARARIVKVSLLPSHVPCCTGSIRQ